MSCTRPETQEKATKKRIHRQMTIEEILGLFPSKSQKLSQEITNAGLHCVGCHAATWETLEAGMTGHGMNDEAIERLVGRLNNLLDEEESNPETVSMTERAAQKFIKILEEDGKPGLALRFGIKVGGCNGFEYLLDYSDKTAEDDISYKNFGVEIHVNKGDLKYLKGSEIDYLDGLHGSGFKISNPNARSSCGCGSSNSF